MLNELNGFLDLCFVPFMSWVLRISNYEMKIGGSPMLVELSEVFGLHFVTFISWVLCSSDNEIKAGES